jgi:hypothetical protein
LRRLFVAFTALALLAVPGIASADSHCVDVRGTAVLDFSAEVREGTANLIIDHTLTTVEFDWLSLTPTGDNTADVFFTWHFPGPYGDLDLTEHSTTTPAGGSLVRFNSTVDVTGGGNDSAFTWTGTADTAKQEARFRITGELCLTV